MSHNIKATQTQRGVVRVTAACGDDPTLGSLAKQDASNVTISGGSISGITDLAVADGGTGASNAADARTNLGLGTADNVTFADMRLTGNLLVEGSKVFINGERTDFADQFLVLNAEYSTASAQKGGLVVNYEPTATTTNVAAGGFDSATRVVNVTSSAAFAVGDIIGIVGSGTVGTTTYRQNDGFYIVSAKPSGTEIEIANPAGEDWANNSFVTDATVAGTVFKTNVAVLRINSSGEWQTGKGNTTPVTYTSITALSPGLVGDITSVDAGDTASAGATGKYADAGHQHAVNTAAPPVSASLAAASAEGGATTLARSNHVHSTDPGSDGVDMGTPTNRWDMYMREEFSPIATVAADPGGAGWAGLHTVLCNAAGGGFAVTLPPPVAGRVLRIKKIDATANAVTITRNNTDVIDGATTQVLDIQWEAVDLQTNGTDWFIVG